MYNFLEKIAEKEISTFFQKRFKGEIFSYPVMNFYESYVLTLDIIEKYNYNVAILLMDFSQKNNEEKNVFLKDIQSFRPFGKNENEIIKDDLQIVFEMYRFKREDDQFKEMDLSNKNIFRDAVLTVAAFHPLYPESAEHPPYPKYNYPIEYSKDEKIGLDKLLDIDLSTKSLVLNTVNCINLNISHVYLQTKQYFEEKLKDLEKKKNQLYFEGNKFIIKKASL